eukprot:5982566-Pleurochrysis_carterae.AAC.1
MSDARPPGLSVGSSVSAAPSSNSCSAPGQPNSSPAADERLHARAEHSSSASDVALCSPPKRNARVKSLESLSSFASMSSSQNARNQLIVIWWCPSMPVASMCAQSELGAAVSISSDS